jgi:hypothetical protein
MSLKKDLDFKRRTEKRRMVRERRKVGIDGNSGKFK